MFIAAMEASRYSRFRLIVLVRHRLHQMIDIKGSFFFVLFFFLYFIFPFFVFADSSIYHRDCTCPALGNLSSGVFLERREGWWRNLGGNWSAVVFHPAGGINHFFRFEDRTWKPRIPGETNEVWHGFTLFVKTSRSAKVQRTLVNGDTSWC